MFYFDEIYGKKILKSSVMDEFQANFELFFTTKEICIKTKEENFIEAANQNRAKVLDYLKIEEKSFFTLEQTHSSNIRICNGENHLKNTDGAILSTPNTGLMLNFADCTPVALYDPKNRIAAGLHAGWRGTAGEIVKMGVKILEKEFNSKPCDLIAVIGPCIAFEDFETGYEVYEALKKTVQNDKNLFKFKQEKVFCDLAEINKRQLNESGVKTVDISQFKTTNANEFFYSYRLENKTANRISMVLKLA